MEELFQQFTRERQFINNVSPRTLEACAWAWKAFEPVLSGRDHVSKADILQRIEELRTGGLSPVSVNTYQRRQGYSGTLCIATIAVVRVEIRPTSWKALGL
jgi:hypothetical protein